MARCALAWRGPAHNTRPSSSRSGCRTEACAMILAPNVKKQSSVKKGDNPVFVGGFFCHKKSRPAYKFTQNQKGPATATFCVNTLGAFPRLFPSVFPLELVNDETDKPKMLNKQNRYE